MGFLDVFFQFSEESWVLEDFECLVDLKNMKRYKTCFRAVSIRVVNTACVMLGCPEG